MMGERISPLPAVGRNDNGVQVEPGTLEWVQELNELGKQANSDKQQTGKQALQTVIDDVLSQNTDQKAETKAVTKPLDSYPAEKQRSIRSYLNAADQKLKNFVQRVKSGDLTFKREKFLT